MSELVKKNLGTVTAYGYAKSKGYTGTEEEFSTLMASYASVAQDASHSASSAAEAAQLASNAAQTASQAAQTATSKASEASQSASTATTKASEASQSASTASAAATSAGTSAQTATTAAATATTKAYEASESAATATTAKTDAETARDAAAQSASAAAESARTLTIDATLTQNGQAADAKAAGDKISGLKEDLTSNIEVIENGLYDTTANLLDFTFDKQLWKQGAPNAAQIYTIYFDKKHPVTQGQVIYGAVKSQVISGLRLLVIAYGSSDEFISRTQLAYNGQTGSYTVPSGIAYVYFGFTTNSVANPINPEQIVSLGNVGYAGSEAVTATDFPERYVPKVQELSKEVAYYNLAGIHMIVGAVRSVSSNDAVDFYDRSVINYRICAPEIQQYDFPITFTPKSGYRIYFNTKAVGEETYTGSGWKTTAVTISAGTKWTVTVAKNPDASAPADLEQFCSAVATDVPFATLKEKIIKIEEEIEKQSDSANHGVNIKYNDRTDALTQLTRMPMFLIFADIHGFGQYLERIGDFHDENCPTFCKDVICLGDIIYNQFSDSFSFMENSDFGKKVLLTIGNHDCYDGTTVGGVSVTDLYNKFFTNVSLWGVVQPTGASTNGYCYYYKDYDNKIRIIVLNEYYWDSAQNTWFESVLADAKTAGLAVIIAQHQGNFTELEYEHLQDYAFGTKEDSFIRYTSGYTDRRNAVDAFVANGGEFIGWINGHTHFEQFGTFTVNGRKQLNMTFSNAGQDITSRMKIVNYSQDCFYYLAVDTTNKWVYVLTIGQATNKYFKRNLMLMYNYQTHEVVEYY